MTDASVRTDPSTPGELPRGRTPALDVREAEKLFKEGVALFNGVRYWEADRKSVV